MKDDSKLALNQTYKLLGYSAIKTSNAVINEKVWTVDEDTVLYPVFIETSVYDIDYMPYLNIENNVIKGLKKNINGDYVY
jgi:hypothetical protein